MRGSLWICTLFVLLILLQWQSMNVYAASDPCAVNKGGCSHFCESNSSSYECACPTGFSLGQDNKTCENTIRCSSLLAPLNGNKTGCTNVTSEPYDAHCNFTCNVGYNLVGSPIRRCLENGTWSGETSYCQAITCPPLETPKGAIIPRNISCNNTYGSKCVFICKAGFVFNWKERKAANVTITCLQSGNWSGSPIKCTERVEPTPDYRRSEKSSVLEIVVGLLVVLIVVVAIINIVGWFKFKTRKTRHVTEENVGQDNQAYGQRRRLSDEEFDMGLSQHVQQPDVNVGPGGHFQTQDNANKRPDNLPFSGAIVSQLEIENKENVLDSPNYSDETLNNHPPTSVPKYITRLEDTFTSTGGELCAPSESDVRIIVPSGAIPAGINQSVFFGVFFDEKTLLRDIPEAPDCTLISPVLECGPHGIHLLKPVEIIVPHCLDLNEAEKEWITVYRCGQFFAQDYLNWEKVPNESEETSQSSQAVFAVKEDAIHIKTKTFSLWSIFACGGPRRKRATVFANRPNSKSDLIYLRFYVYSDNRDSKKHVEVAEKERFPGSKPSREKPFRMYKDSRAITVKLTDLEEGWNFDKTKNTQIYKCGKARGSGFRSTDACDFAVKPEDGRDVNGFSCNVKFQQEDDDQEHSIYLNPGFTPLKRQSARQSSLEGDRSNSTSSTSQAWDHYVSTLGSEPVTEEHIYQISPDVGRDWKNVLRSLSMKAKAIENLSEDHKHEEITEQCIRGLLKWKELKSELATIKILAGALLHARCFDALQTLQNSTR